MGLLQNVVGGFSEATRVAQNVSAWLTHGPTMIFNDVDATHDLLMLTQRVQRISEKIFPFLPLKHISEAVSSVTEFTNVRNIFSGIHDLVSGKSAWEKPFSETCPNFLRIASKCVFIVGDLASLAGWLSSIHLLEAWVKYSTARVVTWGNEFNVLHGIGDTVCVVGSLLSIADTVRLAVDEMKTDGYVKNGHIKSGLVADHLIDVASDISSVAGAILSNIPGVPSLAAVVPFAIGSTLSLGRFLSKVKWDQVKFGKNNGIIDEQ